MSGETPVKTAKGGWRRWAGPLFAAIWGIVGAAYIPAPEKAFMESAPAYAGKLFGFGLAFGLVAAVVAHLLIMRGQSRNARIATYVVGALAGGLCALIVNR